MLVDVNQIHRILNLAKNILLIHDADSSFGFVGIILVLIVPVPDHCLPIKLRSVRTVKRGIALSQTQLT